MKKIQRNGSRPSQKGPEEYFTGTVRIDPVVQAQDPSRVSVGCVTFEPGARSAWHTHPLGQNLIVTSGLGWTQCWGGPIEEIRPGDVLWCPPGVKHWQAMVHQTVTTFGRLDAAYNNAGIQNILADTADTTAEDYDRPFFRHREAPSYVKFERTRRIPYKPFRRVSVLRRDNVRSGEHISL